MTLVGLAFSALPLGLLTFSRVRLKVVTSLGIILAALWLGFYLYHLALQPHLLEVIPFLLVAQASALALTFTRPRIADGVTLVGFVALLATYLLQPLTDIHVVTLMLLAFLLLNMRVLSKYGNRIMQKRARAQLLEMLANHDGLTGLLNRAAAEEKIESWLRQTPTEVSTLLLIDLDHFKTINDQHGHLVGDRALRFAATLLSDLAGPDDHVGRWGGEEFILLLSGADEASARSRIHFLQQCLEEAGNVGLPQISASGGAVTITEAEPPSLESLIQLADTRLYQAKAQGRARFVWSSDLPSA